MHTLGSLFEAAPEYLRAWLGGQLWSDAVYPGMGEAGEAWWYTLYSFGPMLLLVGLLVLTLDKRGLSVPGFIAGALAGWVIVTAVASGPSPLLLLLIAAGLLVVGARRSRSTSSPAAPKFDEGAAPDFTAR